MPVRRPAPRRTALVLAAVLLGGAATTALAAPVRLRLAGGEVRAAASAGVLPPSRDPFYRYTGRTALSKVAPGTPLRHRSVTLGVQRNASPLPAEQVLYRTTDATGKAVVSVTTYLLPVTGTVAPKVVAYLSFYDALGSQCDPSYTLRGGDPGPNNSNNADVEQALVTSLRTQGYVVTVPDFEDETLDYVAGTESGMSTLDGIRATIAQLKLGAATPVALMGYSGGSIAADWAAELAPRYAPRLNLVGVAAGGVPVDLAHNLAYVDGSPVWSSVVPAALIGIARSYHVDLLPYLSAYGRKVVAAESTQCIGDFSGRYPGLTFARLMKPQYSDPTKVPVFRRLLDGLVMGSVPGHPAEPFLLVAGNSDGTGDGVMIARDQRDLALQYCAQGLPVTFLELRGLEHTQAGGAFFVQAMPWLAARFAGVPAPNNCVTL